MITSNKASWEAGIPKGWVVPVDPRNVLRHFGYVKSVFGQVRKHTIFIWKLITSKGSGSSRINNSNYVCRQLADFMQGCSFNPNKARRSAERDFILRLPNEGTRLEAYPVLLVHEFLSPWAWAPKSQNQR